MKIEIIPCLNDNYSYLIVEEKTNTISIVDPSEYEACDQIIKKYNKLDYILNTHHHADHVDGNLKLKKKYNSVVLGFGLEKRCVRPAWKDYRLMGCVNQRPSDSRKTAIAITK